MKKRVAVLMGGRSAERDISLLTGEQIYQALLEKEHEAFKVDLDKNVAEELLRLKPDVVFIALHGRFGEDGTVQGMLEILGLPYTGSGVMASAIGINKAMSKKLFQAAGVETPPYKLFCARDYAKDSAGVLAGSLQTIGIPCVVKPISEGSTIGMSLVRREADFVDAVEHALEHDSEVMVEQLVEGVEITVGVLGNDPIALPTLEIETETDFFDYETKYTAGLSRHIIPARLPEDQQRRAQEAALRAHNAIGCRGFSRVDIIVDKEGTPHVLEINTIPGMTSLSLFPDAARAAGYEFPELISYLIEQALEKP
ncbi:MAG: D-alanine--D-alanine ligase [Candidatus Aquicultor sp.]|nr:D-alanine--D-alanine ligase [Candidatus Aquicultor sp.]